MTSSLYIHIPFCIQKCDYCDFFSRPLSGKIPDSYVEALVNEEKFYAQEYGIKFWKTIYLGGGTPGLLSPDQISRLFEKISPRINRDTIEITMEMNPESVTVEKNLAAKKAGVTRLSLGIQSFNDRALKAVNRHCPSEKAKKSLEIIRENWNGQLNLDAIAGLPCQNQDEFLSSLREITSYNPDHISMYTLTVEEGTPLHGKIEEGKIEFNCDEADSQWIKGKELLESDGYMQYEVSNFSKPGKESRHNMTYWMQGNYAGIGAGATGTFYGKQALRWTNTQDIGKYTAFWTEDKKFDIDSIPRDTEELDQETQEFEFLMMGLRTTRGVNSLEYKKRFSEVNPWKGDLSMRLGEAEGPWNQYSKKECTLKKQEKDGSFTYSLNSKGLMFLNDFLIKLL